MKTRTTTILPISGIIKDNATIKKTVLLFLTVLTVVNAFSETENTIKRIPSTYINWMSIDYVNCLKTSLPCECEKLEEYFIISIDTTKKHVLLYGSRANYDYNLYDFRTLSTTSYEIYSKQYSQALLKDTISIVGQAKVLNDTLLFTNTHGKQTKFIYYSNGESNNYLVEHIKLLNSALTFRGYDKLNNLLQTNSLRCWCNWELGDGMNSVLGKDNKYRILEKKDNELYIYELANFPGKTSIGLNIDKTLLTKLKW